MSLGLSFFLQHFCSPSRLEQYRSHVSIQLYRLLARTSLTPPANNAVPEVIEPSRELVASETLC